MLFRQYVQSVPSSDPAQSGTKHGFFHRARRTRPRHLHFRAPRGGDLSPPALPLASSSRRRTRGSSLIPGQGAADAASSGKRRPGRKGTAVPFLPGEKVILLPPSRAREGGRGVRSPTFFTARKARREKRRIYAPATPPQRPRRFQRKTEDSGVLRRFSWFYP